MTAKTAVNDDKAPSGAPHDATAAPRARTTTRGQNRHTTRTLPPWKPTRALLLRPLQPQMPPQGGALVDSAEQPAALQHRHYLLHKVLKALRQHRRHQVKAISPFIAKPMLHMIGDLLGGAHHGAVPTSGCQPAQQLPDRRVFGCNNPQDGTVTALRPGKGLQRR